MSEALVADDVTLCGLDFGTTTSSAVVAQAKLVRNVVGGRTELTDFRERFRSEMVFTPLDDAERLDLASCERLLDEWLATADVKADTVFGGGTLLTGLAAEKRNAAGLVALVRRKLGPVLVATAADPCFESWLSFLGSCGELSRVLPDVPILNLDIGGGTTNSAIGVGGNVVATGCLFVGARHFRFVPDGYRLVGLSRYAQALLAALKIERTIGDELRPDERERILDAYLELLAALIEGRPITGPLKASHEQVPLASFARREELAVTFSGGVGELIYRHWAGLPLPPTTAFGDFGIDLARHIAEHAAREPTRYGLRPQSVGRATAFGLLRHTTEASGSTLFLPRPEVLPLADLPILGRLDSAGDDETLRAALEFVKRSESGGALQCALAAAGDAASSADVRVFGKRLAAALRAVDFPPALPLVLLVRENIGKTLGQYATEWGALNVNLIVVDEVAPRAAQYLQLGAMRSQVVPVSFFGLRPAEEAS